MKIFHTNWRAFFTATFLLSVLGSVQAMATTCTPPTISATPTDVTCHGAHNGSVSLTVTGGTLPYTYSWTSSTGFTSTAASISGLDSGSYKVVVTEFGGCADSVTVIVSQPAVLDMTTMSNAPFCPGGNLQFYTVTDGGTTPYNYSWAGPAGFSSTDAEPSIAAATAANNGVYTVTVTDNRGCTDINTFSVLLYPEPIVNLGPDTGYICGGTPLPLNAGNPGASFLWNTGAVTQTIVATTTGQYDVAVTNVYACVGRDTIYVASSPMVVPTVTFDPHINNVCEGTTVTLHVTPTHGGTSPSYVWTRNGVVIPGVTNDTYISSTMANNDYYTTRLTSSFACAAPATVYSDTARMVVITNTVTAVSIAYTPDTACSGTPMTFIATPLNGGTSPYFEWLRGGSVVGTGPTYTYSPTSVETVTVKMVSSIVCHTPDTATASTSFVLFPHLVPHAVISATPNDSVTFLGQVIDFFCEVTYGGPNPAYQWYVDRVAVPGATSNTYTRHIYNNDTVRCIVTGNAICSIPNKDTSNTIVIYGSYLTVGVGNVGAGNGNVDIIPNPASGTFTINGNMAILSDDQVLIEVRDLKGSVVFAEMTNTNHGQFSETLSLADQLADGMYIVRIHSDAEEKHLKLVIKK